MILSSAGATFLPAAMGALGFVPLILGRFVDEVVIDFHPFTMSFDSCTAAASASFFFLMLLTVLPIFVS